MNTFLLSSPCDSLVAKVYLYVFSCSPKVAEQGENWTEVITICFICGSILFFLWKLICKFFEWKKKELEMKKEEVNQKREREIEDINRKQKSDLLDLKLKMLKELCDTEAYKKAGCINDKYIEIPTNEGNPAPNPENNGTNNNAEPPKETNPKKETEKANEVNPAPNPENNETNNNAEPPKETNPKKETEKNKEDKPTKDSLSSNVKAYIAAVDDAIKKLNDNNPSNSSSKDGASKS